MDEESDFIVVRDKRIEDAGKRGNPFQLWEGDSFKKPASREKWETAEEQYYIPADKEKPELVENEFECPNCDRHHIGYPEECVECGAGYKWD